MTSLKHSFLLLSIFVVLSSAAAQCDEGPNPPTTTVTATGKPPLVVAHRGLLNNAPENTVAAFQSCLALNMGFEVDVRRASDGVLVCIHDETVDRTTDGNGRVAELTWPQLKSLDAGSWFGTEFRGQRIPSFAQLSQLISVAGNDSTLIAVDLKARWDRRGCGRRSELLTAVEDVSKTHERPCAKADGRLVGCHRPDHGTAGQCLRLLGGESRQVVWTPAECAISTWLVRTNSLSLPRLVSWARQ